MYHLRTVNVTSHVLELGDQLLVADATMLPLTAAEVGALIASTGKPVHTAHVSHKHLITGVVLRRLGI